MVSQNDQNVTVSQDLVLFNAPAGAGTVVNKLEHLDPTVPIFFDMSDWEVVWNGPHFKQLSI